MVNQKRVVDTYRGIKAPARQVVARRWNRWPFTALARLSSSYLRVWSNNNNRMTQNGEEFVLSRLTIPADPVVFDVGANRGDWALMLHDHHPTAIVECFEPAPSTVTALTSRLAGCAQMRVHALALSDRSGQGTLFVSELDPTSSMNSLTKRPSGTGLLTEMAAELRTGDEVMRDLGLCHLDLLKVDTEGHDLSVLRGFKNALTSGAVSVIQFEYNYLSIHSRTLLLDYYELLTPLGYTVGKIHPNGVAFKNYEVGDENWIGPDCIAVHSSRHDLVERLAVGSPAPRN